MMNLLKKVKTQMRTQMNIPRFGAAYIVNKISDAYGSEIQEVDERHWILSDFARSFPKHPPDLTTQAEANLDGSVKRWQPKYDVPGFSFLIPGFNKGAVVYRSRANDQDVEQVYDFLTKLSAIYQHEVPGKADDEADEKMYGDILLDFLKSIRAKTINLIVKQAPDEDANPVDTEASGEYQIDCLG